MSQLSAVEAVPLKGASLLLSFSILDLCDTDQLVSVRQFDRVALGILELCYTRLRVLSSLSEASGAAQVHGDWSIVKASRGVGGVVALEAVLVIPLLSLFWDESPHLIIVSFPEDLVDGFLRYDTVNGSLLQNLVVVARGWFENISSYAWDQSSYEISVGGGIS